jgi:serine/threonine-protein phosphatase 6 regulatory ankyrin repeat subunit B
MTKRKTKTMTLIFCDGYGTYKTHFHSFTENPLRTEGVPLNHNHDSPHLFALHDACHKGDVNVVKKLLALGVDTEVYMDIDENNQMTPLMLAANQGHTDVVEVLLSHGANLNASTFHSRVTPLTAAIKNNHTDIVDLILDYAHNSSVDLLNAGYAFGPLQLAVHLDNAEMVNLLLSYGAKPYFTYSDSTNSSVLHYAVKEGKLQVVKLLADKKIDLETTELVFGNLTPLGVAALRGYANITRTLLENGAKIDAVQGEIGTPLFLAADIGFVDVVKVLLHHHANTEIPGQHETTPLFVASENGHADVLKLLLEHGANPNREMVRFISIDTANTNVREAFRDQDNKQKLVINVLFNSENKEMSKSVMYWHETALYQATKHNQTDVVKVLLQYGADTEIPRRHAGTRITPLHVACQLGLTEVAELLLQVGANVNCITHEGATPLHQAIGFGRQDIVDLLIKHGADTRAKDNNGNTPFDYSDNIYADELRYLLDTTFNLKVNSIKQKKQRRAHWNIQQADSSIVA